MSRGRPFVSHRFISKPLPLSSLKILFKTRCAPAKSLSVSPAIFLNVTFILGFSFLVLVTLNKPSTTFSTVGCSKAGSAQSCPS